MWDPIDKVDLSDIRFFIIGCLLLLIPLLYLVSRSDRGADEGEFAQQAIESRASAFDLLPARPTGPGAAGRPARAGSIMSQIEAKPESINTELEKAWSTISGTPRHRIYPPNMAPEAIKMSEAAEEPGIVNGNANLDAGDFAAAELEFKNALDHAQGNAFLEVEAYGGLMETYKRQGKLTEFVKAFKAYALAAQKLKHVYGPFADNIARASDMFDQLAQVDPGKLREELAKGNLRMGTQVDLEKFMQAIRDARQMYPTDLPAGEASIPKGPGS